jgi:hypothetical protein
VSNTTKKQSPFYILTSESWLDTNILGETRDIDDANLITSQFNKALEDFLWQRGSI